MKYCANCGQLLIVKIIDNRGRMACTDEHCGYIHWNNPVPVVAMIVETVAGIVLAHNKMIPPGFYSIITGFLEAGEDPALAAARETKEELGLDAVQTTFLGVFPFIKFNQLIIAYHIQATGNIVLNEELDDYKFVLREDLLGYNRSGRFEITEWLEKLRVLEEA